MWGRVSKAEALTELRGVVRTFQNIYLHGFSERDMQMEIMMRHLVKIADYIGGTDAVLEVFKEKVKPHEVVSNWFSVRSAVNAVIRFFNLLWYVSLDANEDKGEDAEN